MIDVSVGEASGSDDVRSIVARWGQRLVGKSMPLDRGGMAAERWMREQAIRLCALLVRHGQVDVLVAYPGMVIVVGRGDALVIGFDPYARSISLRGRILGEPYQLER